MKRVLLSMGLLSWMLVMALCLAVPTTGRTHEISPEQEAKEKAVDKEHLRTIWKALMDFQKAKGKLPDYLSDLVPQFLPDKAVLDSPVKGYKKNKTDPRLNTAYVYEFRAEPISDGGPTNHEAKQLQMLEYGPAVLPILRCFTHRDAMNVSFNGTYYESTHVWEESDTVRALIKEKGLGAGLDRGDFTVLHVQDPTGKPLAGASVALSNRQLWALGLPNRTLTTDATGTVRIPLGPPAPEASRSLTVSVYKPGLYGPRESWMDGIVQEGRRESGFQKEVTWQMRPAKIIGGVVRNADGSPAPDVWVTVYVLPRFRDVPGTFEGEPTPQFAEERQTDAQGRWTCGSIPAEATEMTLRVTQRQIWWREYRTAARGEVPRRGKRESPVDASLGVTLEDLLAQKAEFRIEPRVALSVGVQKADGSPVPYQEVSMTSRSAALEDGEENHGLIMWRNRTTWSRSHGGVTGHVIYYFNEPMEVTVSAYPTKDSALVIRKVVATPGAPPIDLRAAPRRRVAGKVVDPEGHPLEGVRMTYIGEPGQKVEKEITRTNSNGDFAWDAAPVTEVGLVFYREGFVRFTQWVPVEKKDPLTVEMQLSPDQ